MSKSTSGTHFDPDTDPPPDEFDEVVVSRKDSDGDDSKVEQGIEGNNVLNLQDLIGRTFLKEHDEDGNRDRAWIEGISNEEDIYDHAEPVKFWIRFE